MSTDLIQNNLPVLAKAEIDCQITTAKAYPRDIKRALDQAMFIATFNPDVAESCMYALPRDGKTITGPSIRLAEIMLNSWTNIHCSTRLVRNDGRFIAVEAIVIDRENNMIYAETVERSIMTSGKNGKTPRQYSNDMIQTTAAAAASIALRKAAFRLIPVAFRDVIFEATKKAALGDVKSISAVQEKAVAYFEKLGIAKEKILSYFDVSQVSDLTSEMLHSIVGIKNSIKDGLIDKDNAFDKTFNMETGEVAETNADQVNNKLTHQA